MTVMGFNLDETKSFIKEVKSLRSKIKVDPEFKRKILFHKSEYFSIKDYFKKIVRFLKYTNTINIENFYRVRKVDGDNPFTSKSGVMYPAPNIEHEDRMNNTSFSVLYVSFNEFTAMAETRMDKSFVGKNFQLTRFSTDKEFTIFKLGLFSELYLNSPRDSEYVKSEMVKLFGSENHNKTIQGYAALECAISEVLYAQDDDHHVLSSILADAIFSENPDVEALLYPSMQNRYGLNLAIKKEFADTLTISHTALNCLIEVYDNGFYKYSTLKDCIDCSNAEQFIFVETEGQCVYR